MGLSDTPASAECRLAVYTTIIGSGYVLPPARGRAGVDFLCFTDQARLDPNGWTLVEVVPVLPDDLARSSRETKIRPHRWLPDHTLSLYIDPSVELTCDPRALWEHLMGGSLVAVFGAMLHSFRDSLADEFDAVLSEDLDEPHVVVEQLHAYRRANSSVLSQRPVFGGMLARRHHELACIHVMELWYAHVLRYSRRDQLSLPAILATAPSGSVSLVRGDIHRSELHRWPIRGYARPARYLEAAKRAASMNEVEARLAAERDVARAERDEARAALDSVTGSRIWRATSLYRALRDRCRKRGRTAADGT